MRTIRTGLAYIETFMMPLVMLTAPSTLSGVMLGFVSTASRASALKSAFTATPIAETTEMTTKMRNGPRMLGRLTMDSNVGMGLTNTPMILWSVFGVSGSAAEGGTTSVAVISAAGLLCRGLRSQPIVPIPATKEVRFVDGGDIDGDTADVAEVADGAVER